MAPGLVGKEKAARGKLPTDTWWHTIVAPNSHEKTGYPTQKPLGILRRIITASSNAGDTVLDFFAGSGTVGAACLELERHFILIDNNPQAFQVMKKRIKVLPPSNGWSEWFNKGKSDKLEYPILEFDPDPQAILFPQVDSIRGKLPEKAVLCFFQDVLQEHLRNGKLEIVGSLKSEIGLNPIYVTSLNNQWITVMHPGVGAALSAGFLERLIAAGVKKFIVCGGVWVLSEDLPAGIPHFRRVESAIRVEGTILSLSPPFTRKFTRAGGIVREKDH
jgi:hypothetical protein